MILCFFSASDTGNWGASFTLRPNFQLKFGRSAHRINELQNNKLENIFGVFLPFLNKWRNSTFYLFIINIMAQK